MTCTTIERGSRCITVAEWPAADLAAWGMALKPPDLLDLESGIGYAHRWKPSTRSLIQEGYGHWLGWLDRAGMLDPASSPASRICRKTVATYATRLREAGLAPHTVAGRLEQLGSALRAIAPGTNWAWVERGASRLRQAATPVHDMRAGIQPAEDVLKLGLDLMHAAETDRFRTVTDRATLYRDGLLIALVIKRPMRRANVASIAIGRELQLHGDVWRLAFDDPAMKASRPYELSWPPELQTCLARYMDVHRRVLLKCSRKNLPDTNALWISQHGTPMTGSAILLQIKSRTFEAFGEPINIHKFRHIVATDTATITPHNASDIPALLAHNSPEAGENHYNLAKMIDAGNRHQGTIAAIRKGIDKWTD